jgi:hypothetical protein
MWKECWLDLFASSTTGTIRCIGHTCKPRHVERVQKRPRGGTRSKLVIDEERTVTVAAPPRGSRFKGFTSFVVQDLVIHFSDAR